MVDYDIVVIGAGIHGAGVLQAAAAHGYRALLLEQYAEPALGTSSKSTKLIHGGLRYLENGEISLVYECLRERKILLRNAPNLVKLSDFYIPIYKSSKRGRWLVRAGLSLYTLLAGLSKQTLFKTIPQSNWAILNGLKTTELDTVFCYADAQTDDAALTKAVIDSAESLGANAFFSSEFMSAEKNADGYQCRYQQGNNTMNITTHTIVNAGGPWVNHIMQKIRPEPSAPTIDLVQGTHIVIPGNTDEKIYYIETEDGRAVFITPWKNNIMVGTTELPFNDDPALSAPTDQEIEYLLSVFNNYFPKFYNGRMATRKDIIESFAGLRVLPNNENQPFKRSRETVFVKDNQSKPTLIGIYGGKLTSYRATAESVIKQLRHSLPKTEPKANTKNILLQ